MYNMGTDKDCFLLFKDDFLIFFIVNTITDGSVFFKVHPMIGDVKISLVWFWNRMVVLKLQYTSESLLVLSKAQITGPQS